jgi:hypothetical protein
MFARLLEPEWQMVLVPALGVAVTLGTLWIGKTLAHRDSSEDSLSLSGELRLDRLSKSQALRLTAKIEDTFK